MSLKTTKDKAAVYLRKALDFFEMQEYFKSKEFYRLVYESHPEWMDETAFLNYGLSFDALGDLKQALSVFEAGSEHFPQSSALYYSTAMILEDLDEAEDALNLYLKALEIAPDYVDALYNIACIYDDQDRTGEADSYLQKVLSIDPCHRGALMILGCNHEKAGRDQEALALFLRALEQEKHPDLLFNLGVVCAKLGYVDKSIRYYMDALEQDECNPYIYLNLSLLYKGMDDFEQALSLLTKGIKKCEHNNFLYYHRACLYALKSGETNEYKDRVISDFLSAYHTNSVFWEEAQKDNDLKNFLCLLQQSIL